MSVAAVSTTQTIELTFPSSERFALSCESHSQRFRNGECDLPSAVSPHPRHLVHLMFVDGIPMLPPGRVPTLVQDDGRFYASWRPFIVASLMGRIAMEEIEA